MKKKLSLFIMLCLPLLLNAQEANGINWTSGLTWEQVKLKAKTENKNIFVDVYATWCGPCKQMDKYVYPQAQVGKVYNESFISIKIQSDRTENDDSAVKNLYEDAKKICNEYKVVTFPTFLFISGEGKLIHRASGGLNSEKFLKLANDAMHGNGYGASVEAYKRGAYENMDLKELSLTAKYAGDDSLSRAIAFTYIQKLDVHDLIKQENLVFVSDIRGPDKEWIKRICWPKINTLTDDERANPEAIRFLLYIINDDLLITKATDTWVSKMTKKQIFSKLTLEYLKSFLRTSKGKSFEILYRNSRLVDKIMGEKNWAQSSLDDVIYKEEFNEPILKPAAKMIRSDISMLSVVSEPKWEKICSTIKQKYGKGYVRRFQYKAKISWYKTVRNKKEYTKNIIAEMNQTRGWKLNGFILNNYAMEIFECSNNKKELQKACYWMRKYFEQNPREMQTDAAGMDTYACLLYKVGIVEEAIRWQERAVATDGDSAEIKDNLHKMRKGLPIWPDSSKVEN